MIKNARKKEQELSKNYPKKKSGSVAKIPPMAQIYSRSLFAPVQLKDINDRPRAFKG
jgi:hypothetical protein